MSRKRSVGYLNIDIFNEFTAILARFSRTNRFEFDSYVSFFRNGNIDEITRFFNEIQQFVINVVFHIIEVEAGRNFFSKYFLDLSLLLAGNMNTAFRTAMIDNSRTNVDVSQFSIKGIFEDMQRLSTSFGGVNKLTLIIPNDCSLLYNIADYTVAIFNTNTREFEIPHVVETKKLSKPEDISETQRIRMKRQLESMRNSAVNFNFQTNHNLFNDLPTYIPSIESGLRECMKLSIENGLLEVDTVFSICTKPNRYIPINSKEYLPLFNEMHFGNIRPFLFRGVNLELFKNLIEANYPVLLHVDLNVMKESLREVDGFDKFQKGNSLRNEFVVLNGQQVNIAGLINLKIPINGITAMLSNPEFYNRTQGERISIDISSVE